MIRLGLVKQATVVALLIMGSQVAPPMAAAYSPDEGIGSLTLSRSVVEVHPSGQVGLPRASFKVTMPTASSDLENITVRFRIPLGGTVSRSVSWNALWCGDAGFTCRRNGSEVTVAVPLRLFDADMASGLGDPGVYKPIVSAYIVDKGVADNYISSAPKTPTLTIKRVARFVGFNAGPEPVRKGGKVTVSGTLRRALECESEDNLPVCDGGHVGYWRGFGGRSLAVYFDPAGAASAKYRGTVTTNSRGAFAARFSAARAGTWFVTYVGDSRHGTARSRKDYVPIK